MGSPWPQFCDALSKLEVCMAARRSASKGTSSKPRSPKRASSKRTLINTGTDKRYVRRSAGGQFKESDDVGRSLAADRRTKAKTKAKRGQGDRGDR
jgi:hypothetical protein